MAVGLAPGVATRGRRTKPAGDAALRGVGTGAGNHRLRYGEPAGWCSVSPRRTLPGLDQVSAHLGESDPENWVVICFYVPERQRGQGMMLRLLEAAVRYAAENGARIVEGYPFEAAHADDGAGGTIEVFERAGFREVRRVSERQAVMRWWAVRT